MWLALTDLSIFTETRHTNGTSEKPSGVAWEEVQTHSLLGPANASHKGSEVSTLNIVNKVIFKTLRKEFAPVADSMRDSMSWILSSGIIITSSSENLFLGKELQQTDFGELCCPDARTVLSKVLEWLLKRRAFTALDLVVRRTITNKLIPMWCVIFTRPFPTLPDIKCQKLSSIFRLGNFSGGTVSTICESLHPMLVTSPKARIQGV